MDKTNNKKDEKQCCECGYCSSDWRRSFSDSEKVSYCNLHADLTLYYGDACEDFME